MEIFKTPQLFANRLLLAICWVLPWINPFTSAPSTSVVPLLLSWMLAACALLLVVDEAPAPSNQALSSKFHLATPGPWGLLLLGWFWVSALTVPEVIDRALTAGYFASLACVWIAMQVGKRVANSNNGLLPWLLGAVLLAALMSSVLAVLQYLGLAADLSPWVNQPRAGDAFANLRQRNQFASLTSLGLVALLGWIALARNRTKPQEAMAWFALTLLAAGLACSVSRTGAVQWLVLALLALFFAWKERRKVPPFFKALAIAAPLLVIFWSCVLPWIALELNGVMGASLLLRFSGQAQDYAVCGGRRVLWSNVFHMLGQYPWQGWGLGETDFAHYSTDYHGMRFCDLLDNGHNLPLHLALELGVPFALACCAVSLYWFYFQGKGRAPQPVHRVAGAWLIVLGLHSMLEYPLWYGPFQISLGLALGMWSVSASNGGVEEDIGIRAQMLPIFVCACLFLSCLFAAWDYNRVAQIYRQPAMRDTAYRDNPMQSAKQTWLFKNQVDFAQLMTQTITPENAQETYDLGLRVLHYSPEPRVLERIALSLRVLGRDVEAEKIEKRIPSLAPLK